MARTPIPAAQAVITEPPAITISAKDLPRTRSQTHTDVYSNFVMANLSPADVTLIFGRVKQGAPNVMVNEDQVTVTLPPIQFKLLADLCRRITEAYELAYVPIELGVLGKEPKPTPQQIAEMILGAQAKAIDSPSSNAPSRRGKRSVAGPKKIAKKP